LAGAFLAAAFAAWDFSVGGFSAVAFFARGFFAAAFFTAARTAKAIAEHGVSLTESSVFTSCLSFRILASATLRQSADLARPAATPHIILMTYYFPI
jgi:sugar phosphate isomerase/epimerase